MTLALAGAVTAGCTTTSAGEPRPQNPPAGSAGGEPTSTIEGLPPRPREISLDNVEICELIPEADYPDFYLDGPGEPGTDSDDNQLCAWDDGEVGYFGIVLDITEGAEVWLDGSKLVQGEIVDPILDFGAVAYQLEDDGKSCFVSVDVADGQQLTVQIGIDNTSVELPPVCEYAHQFATSAMGTLVES